MRFKTTDDLFKSTDLKELNFITDDRISVSLPTARKHALVVVAAITADAAPITNQGKSCCKQACT